MKKLLKVVLAALMVLSLVACGGTKTDEPVVEDDNTINVAVLIPFAGDQSYFDTLARGGKALDGTTYGGKDIKVDVFECDKDGKAEAENWANWFDDVCEDGKYDLVVSGNNSYEAFLYTACEKYPEQKFMNFDMSSVPETGCPANCYCVQYALDDLGYAVGALSAALTKTGVVGVVVGMDNQAMNQFISGYVQILADNDVKYVIDYPGSFTDADKGKLHTEQMIEQANCDVIWQVAGGLGNGVIAACAEYDNVWCVGVDNDQYNTFKDTNPEWANTIITSALKNANVALRLAVEDLIDGKLALGTTRQLGIADNGVGVAENDYYKANTTEEIRNGIADLLAKAASGEIEIYDSMADADYEANWPAIRDKNIATVTIAE